MNYIKTLHFRAADCSASVEDVRDIRLEIAITIYALREHIFNGTQFQDAIGDVSIESLEDEDSFMEITLMDDMSRYFGNVEYFHQLNHLYIEAEEEYIKSLVNMADHVPRKKDAILIALSQLFKYSGY